MTDGAEIVSLKGEGAAWSGLGDDSVMLPGPATFSRLDGCYISKDGTEIRRAPGSQIGGRPFYGQEWPIDSITGTATWTVTLDSAAQDDDECYLPDVFAVYFIGSGNPSIDNKIVVAAKNGSNSFAVAGTGSAPTSGQGVVLVQRVRHVHALTHIGDRVVAVCETRVSAGAAERYNVGACVSSGPLDFEDPVLPGERDDHPDEGGFVLWPSPTMTGMSPGERAYTDGLPVAAAQTIDVARRIQVDALNKRVVIAVPGSTILHQVDLGRGPPWMPVVADQPESNGLPNHRWTRMLGIPRGAISSVTVTAGGSLTASMWYGIGVAYWDPFTGEVGLGSEVWAVQTGTASSGDHTITVQLPRPRWAAPESVGLGVVLFCTTTGFATRAEAENGVLAPCQYHGPYDTATDYLYWTGSTRTAGVNEAWITLTIDGSSAALPDPDNQILPGRFPVLELPAPGGSVIRTVRGRVFAGGAYPETWSFDAWTWTEAGRGTELWLPSDGASVTLTNAGPGAHGTIPDGFAGYRVQRDGLTVGQGRGILLGQVNACYRPSATTFAFLVRGWRTDFQSGTSAAFDEPNLRPYVLQAPLTRLAFSEEGFPAVCPASNRLELDTFRSERLMGLARVGDALLAMTERETVLFSWSAAPLQSSQVSISNQYGCVAPSSVVEGPFGVAWLSHEGPVVFGGDGIRWIGGRIRRLWDSIQKDSRGELHYATGAVDLERGLVVWALRTDEFLDDTDQENALATPDLLLVWSYTRNEFTTITPTLCSEPDCLAVLPYAGGRTRLSWSNTTDAQSIYRDIYGWDEDSADRAEEPTTLTVTAARTAGSATVAVSAGALARRGEDQAFIRSSDKTTCRWFGRLSQVTGDTAVVVEDDDGATWRAGDRMVIGVIHQTLVTNRLRFGDLAYDSMLSGVVIRAEVDATVAYAKVSVQNELGEEAVLTSRWGDRLRSGTTRFRAGRLSGTELILTVQIVSDGRVTVKDIGLEVQGGDR